MKKVTIYEIAEELGLSPATVSRAIHSPQLLRPQTLDTIQRAMRKKNYTYNAAAANLSRGSSTSIHVLIPALGSSVFTPTVMGIQEHVFRHGFSVVLSSTNYDSRYEIELLKQAKEQQCAGILLTGCCKANESKIKRLAASGLPIVVMWQKGPNGLNSVGFDNYGVTRETIEYLVSLGHRRIGGIFGPCALFHRAQMRLDAYLDVLRENDLEIDPFLYSENLPTVEDGKKAMARFLQLKSRPTAVFCTNDLQAVGAYDVIRKTGLRIPDDISVFGFDDIELAPYLTPALSTVHVPSYELGTISAEQLLGMLGKTSVSAVHRTVETPLRIRESCAPPAGQSPLRPSTASRTLSEASVIPSDLSPVKPRTPDSVPGQKGVSHSDGVIPTTMTLGPR